MYLFSPEDYAAILDNLVIVCVDTIVFDSNNRVLLGKRNKFPNKGWWIFGGRMEAHEDYVATSIRGLKRELGLEASSQPTFVGYYDLVWENRFEEPQSNGCHVLLAAMKYQMSESEIQASLVVSQEHDGVRWFDADQLRKLEIHPELRAVLSDASLL